MNKNLTVSISGRIYWSKKCLTKSYENSKRGVGIKRFVDYIIIPRLGKYDGGNKSSRRKLEIDIKNKK
jgi:hypothetical protein